MDNHFHKLVNLLNSGAKVQTGTILVKKGSAPQLPGAMAIFDQEQVVSGTLGGGLLEARAQKAAALSKKNQLNTLEWVHFDTDKADQEGAICGGSALFLIDVNPKQYLDTYSKLLHSIRHHRCGALVTSIRKNKNQELLVERHWLEKNSKISGTLKALIKTGKVDLANIISTRTPCFIESLGSFELNPDEQISLFIQPIHPVPQLIIVGAGHIGQALCKVSSLVDFEITVVDNRPELATQSRFPEASQIICKSFTEAFQAIHLSTETYIVIATQGHLADIEALKCCIGSSAAYIGVIGSKRKTLLMGQEILAKKWATADEWDFVHAPIGIDIHSKSVNEIAISILAELISERYENYFLRPAKKISAILLAAGKSTRMGQQKLLLPFEGLTMVQSIVEKMERSRSNQSIVVTGSHRNEIKNSLQAYDVLFVDNDKFEDGMLSSVQAGVEAIANEADGLIVLLGDQPMVSEATINRLIAVFNKTEKGLLIPTFKGKRGHPVLISSRYKQAIKSINPEIGLRELFMNNRDDILEIELDSADVLKDIDTPEDYQLANMKKTNK